MNRCRLFVQLIAIYFVIVAAGCGRTPAPATEDAAAVAEATLTRVGDLAPDFTVTRLDGGTFTLAEQRGKVALVNWWATWCPPCVQEMPHLQERVWERFRGEDFAMIAVSREETPEKVAPWIAEKGYTFPIAIDPDRGAYGRYATAYIPRNYVVGRDGRIVFQSQGYEEAEFAALVAAIEAALAAGP